MADGDGTVLIEDAKIVLRNFEGKEDKFNAKGTRSFCVLLDEKLATDLDEDGWNVRSFKSKEPDEPDQPFIRVAVSFKNKPSLIVMITSGGRTTVTEDLVEILDSVDIKKVDLIFQPYAWNAAGKSGIKAYLKTMFIEIQEDALQLKYRELDELPTRSGRVDE